MHSINSEAGADAQEEETQPLLSSARVEGEAAHSSDAAGTSRSPPAPGGFAISTRHLCADPDCIAYARPPARGRRNAVPFPSAKDAGRAAGATAKAFDTQELPPQVRV